MPTEITVESALAAIKRAVDEKGPDHKISNCVYFGNETAKPICLIGFVLHYHGYTMDDLVADCVAESGGIGALSSSFGRLNSCAIRYLPGNCSRIKITPEAIDVLSAAQLAQDKGESWGEAQRLAQQAAAKIPRPSL